MIKFENLEVVGFEPAIRGMRNSRNSWAKSDSHFIYDYDSSDPYGDRYIYEDIGKNDLTLMKTLAENGPVHAKYRRMIQVYVDIIAPLYWWKEFDTYKVGTVANSCSTMYKIADKEFTTDDFSFEHMFVRTLGRLKKDIEELNMWRNIYLNGGEVTVEHGRKQYFERNSKDAWWQMIQLLPTSYNQRRTVMLNYETLTDIYHTGRKNHKQDEWRDFCTMIESLPYSQIILV